MQARKKQSPNHHHLLLLLCCDTTNLNSFSCAKYCFSLKLIKTTITKKKNIAQYQKTTTMKSRTKSSSSSANASITATTKAAATCDSPKHYPSISAAYWLPAPNPTPYLLPGNMSDKLRIKTIKIHFSLDNAPANNEKALLFLLLLHVNRNFEFFRRTQAVRRHVEQEVQ